VRFFEREAAPPQDFWGWWSGARDRLGGAISSAGVDAAFVEEISRAVNAIHPEMAWELAPGKDAEHAFCISPEGRADLRPLALRWLETAPPSDATWEYHASRQARETLARLEIAGFQFDLAEMRTIANWDATTRRLHVRLWHPRFEAIPPTVRIQVAFLFLDNLLGEDDVERWIGQVEVLDAPTGGRTPEEVREEIERHRHQPAGDESWVLGQLDGPDGPAIVLANAALKRIDHPFADQHVSIGIVLEGERGLPDDAEAAQLNAEEDDLVARFDGIAAYAGRTTRPAVRTLHFVAEDLERVRETIDAWALGLPDDPPRRIKVNFTHDVDWLFRTELGLG
jgi:hypothetical protein